ncbi:MAG: hypothetical protein R3A11_07505 [Bdellovibrionota bacterium]
MKRLNLFLMILFLAQPSYAFIVPPDYALKQWTSQIESIQSLHIKAVRKADSRGLFENEAKVQEEIWIKRPNLYKRVETSSTGTQQWIIAKDRPYRLDAQGKAQMAGIDQVIDVASLFFLAKQPSRIQSMAKQMGIDSSLKKLLDHPSGKEILYGSNESESGFSFLVTEGKGQYFPIRLIQGKRTYVFSYVPTSVYPNEIKIYDRSTLKEIIVVEDVTINPVISDQMFLVKGN